MEYFYSGNCDQRKEFGIEMIKKRKRKWENQLQYDALFPLAVSGNEGIKLFAERDLMDRNVQLDSLWQLPEAEKILKKQRPDGSWKYPSYTDRTAKENMDQYQTFKILGSLVEQYGFDKGHPSIDLAAEYFFSNQTSAGDFRGIYDKQYTPNYTAAIGELLIKAGYGEDSRIRRVFHWLVDIRQEDGGWALPFRTRGHNIHVAYKYGETIEPDLSKPSSHMVTGVVLRAFASHGQYRNAPEATHAGRILAESLFQKDRYPDRGTKKYWTQFVFPFCYTDLISALDTLSILGFSADEPKINKALEWFREQQQSTGMWQLKITAGRNKETLQLWLSLAICRIFKRFYDENAR